jgi:hypothetical protein
MADDTLFIALDPKCPTLGVVANSVFMALGLSETEERFSSNYPPDDHYFVGYAANAVIKVFDLDDLKDGYPYCVSIDPITYRKGDTAVPDNATTIANSLAQAGLQVFVPTDRWADREWDGGGTTYAL